jgi:hypothetical protein
MTIEQAELSAVERLLLLERLGESFIKEILNDVYSLFRYCIGHDWAIMETRRLFYEHCSLSHCIEVYLVEMEQYK